MPLGPAVRRMFGPYETQVAELWRALFIDLDAWTDRISLWMPDPKRILEVGCGEGAMTERLAQRFPGAHITAIDVTPRLGRLFRGDAERVTFLQTPVEDIALASPNEFDLIILSDVLHHVPPPARGPLLAAIRDALAPGGVFAFKEWTRARTPIHWLCEASDRFLTGDDVSYLDAPEAKALLATYFGPGAIRAEAQVAPWSNNRALLLLSECADERRGAGACAAIAGPD